MAEVDALILKAAAEGCSPRELAEAHGMTEPEVLAVLDKEAVRRFSGETLRRSLLLEAERLERLEEHYYRRAMTDDEGSATAGNLYVKLSERRAILLGLNATPASATLSITQTAEATRMTSTERIFALIDRIKSMPKPKPDGELPAPEGNGAAE